jgi:DNA-binding transcriptional MerR regulator
VLKIGELARISGLRAQTIRNYEQHSLIKPAARSEAGHHRLYRAEEVAWLQFIRHTPVRTAFLSRLTPCRQLVNKG